LISHHYSAVKKITDLQQYWRSNLRIVTVLLSIWFVVTFCISILFIQPLNSFSIGELGLGFWFAQQGSIFVFVVLVFAYAILMDRLDRKHKVDE
jgi:putative solute:sodium symporter small subunit